MNICVLKEIKVDENRVALQPHQAKKLIDLGHTIFVEYNAGLNSGFSNDDYEQNGAIIVSKNIALEKAKLVLKVKAPLESEYNDYKKNQILFTYLHFDENIPKEKILKLINSGFTGIAYEWVGGNGNYPLLNPMSRLTGYLFAQKSIELLSKHKGKMAGMYEDDHTPANILIIGLGTIGASAFKYSDNNGLKITVVDKHPETINDRLNKRFKSNNIDYCENIKIITFDMDNPLECKNKISTEINKYDIILNCAVRRSDLTIEKLKYLIDKEMIMKMEKGSIICDTSACDKDFIETCVSSSKLEHVDVISGIVHYNCDHLPSSVANTASKILTNETFKYICEIANNGVESAIRMDNELRNGVSCRDGFITHKYSSDKKNMQDNYKTINEIIK